MAELILPNLPEEPKKPRASMAERMDSIRKSSASLTDNLVLLTISFWYFFWTGIAVMRGKKIPKQWLDISTALSKKKIAEKISPPHQIPAVVKHRVVDLETNLPLPTSQLLN